MSVQSLHVPKETSANMNKVVMSVNFHGEMVTFKCYPDIRDILRSSSTDPNVKEIICTSLLEGKDVTLGPLGPTQSTKELQKEAVDPIYNEEGSKTPKSAEAEIIDSTILPKEKASLPSSVPKAKSQKEETNPEEGKPKAQKLDPQRWSPRSEKLLLAKHKEMAESRRVPRNKWLKIASDINQFDYSFTGEQCRLKIKSLKEKYERNRKKNKTSGESPATEDEDLDENFRTLPDMNPEVTIDSGSVMSEESTSQQVDSLTEDDSIQPSTSKGGQGALAKEIPRSRHSSDEEESGGSVEKKRERKRPRRSSEVMMKFLGEFMEKKEEGAERRHQEKLQAVTSLIDVLKETLKK